MELTKKQERNRDEAKRLKAWIDGKLKKHPRIKSVKKPEYLLKIHEHLDSDGTAFYSCAGHIDEYLFKHNVYYYFKKNLGIIKKRYIRQQLIKPEERNRIKPPNYMRTVYCNENEPGAEPLTIGIERG